MTQVRVGVKLTGFKELGQALSLSRRELLKTATATKASNKELAKFGKSTALNNELLFRMLKELKAVRVGVEATSRGINLADTRVKKFGSTISKTTSQVRTIKEPLRKVKKEIKGMGEETEKSGKKVNKARTALRNFGSAAVFALGPLSGLGARAATFGSLMQRSGFAIAVVVGTIAALTFAVVKLGVALIKTKLELDRIRNTLLAATGSTKKASQEFRFASKVARQFGLDLRTAALQFAQLTAAARGTSLTTKQIRDVFESVAVASTALGLSAEQTSGALRALQQVISKGTVQAEELRGQLGERIPGAFQIAARAMGVTTAALGKMLEQGQLLSEDFIPKFAKQLREELAPAAIEAAKALAPTFERLSTAIFGVLAAAEENLGAGGKASGIVEFFTKAANAFQIFEKTGSLKERTNELKELTKQLAAGGKAVEMLVRFGNVEEIIIPFSPVELIEAQDRAKELAAQVSNIQKDITDLNKTIEGIGEAPPAPQLRGRKDPLTVFGKTFTVIKAELDGILEARDEALRLFNETQQAVAEGAVLLKPESEFIESFEQTNSELQNRINLLLKILQNIRDSARKISEESGRPLPKIFEFTDINIPGKLARGRATGAGGEDLGEEAEDRVKALEDRRKQLAKFNDLLKIGTKELQFQIEINGLVDLQQKIRIIEKKKEVDLDKSRLSIIKQFPRLTEEELSPLVDKNAQLIKLIAAQKIEQLELNDAIKKSVDRNKEVGQAVLNRAKFSRRAVVTLQKQDQLVADTLKKIENETLVLQTQILLGKERSNVEKDILAIRLAGKITGEEDLKNIRAALELREKTRKELDRIIAEQKQIDKILEDIAERISETFSDAFAEILRNGEFTFRELGNRIKDIMADVAGEIAGFFFKQEIVGPLLAKFGFSRVADSLAPGSTGGGSFFDSIFGVVGGLFGGTGAAGGGGAFAAGAAGPPAVPAAGGAAGGAAGAASAIPGIGQFIALGILDFTTGIALGTAIGGNQKGATIGALTSNLVGIPAIFGGIIGGFFGRTPKPQSSARIRADDGRLELGRIAVAQGENQARLRNAVRSVTDPINDILEATGLTISDELNLRVGTFKGSFSLGGLPGQKRKAGLSKKAFKRRLIKGIISGDVLEGNEVIIGALSALAQIGKSLEEIGQAGVFLENILDTVPDRLTKAGEQLDLFLKIFKDLSEAQRDPIREAFRIDFSEDIQKSILEITDPLQAALDEFEKIAEERLEVAAALGADLVAVERLNMLERVQILEQFGREVVEANERFGLTIQEIADFLANNTARDIINIPGFDASSRAPTLTPDIPLSDTPVGLQPILSVQGFAHGGQFIATRPTLFTAGERGAELINVTPLGRGSSSGNTIQVIFQGDTILDEVSAGKFADRVADAVNRRSRSLI